MLPIEARKQAIPWLASKLEGDTAHAAKVLTELDSEGLVSWDGGSSFALTSTTDRRLLGIDSRLLDEDALVRSGEQGRRLAIDLDIARARRGIMPGQRTPAPIRELDSPNRLVRDAAINARIDAEIASWGRK